MKDLCTAKKYDLSQLNDEQLLYFCKQAKGIYSKTQLKYASYCDKRKRWGFVNGFNKKHEITNALELFENELQKQYSECYGKDETNIYDDMLSLIEKGKQQGLKIVVTFEKI